MNPPVHICFNISKDLQRALIKNYAYVEYSKNVKTCTFSQVLFYTRYDFWFFLSTYLHKSNLCRCSSVRSHIKMYYLNFWQIRSYKKMEIFAVINICTTFQKLSPPPIIQSFFNPSRISSMYFKQILIDILLGHLV